MGQRERERGIFTSRAGLYITYEENWLIFYHSTISSSLQLLLDLQLQCHKYVLYYSPIYFSSSNSSKPQQQTLQLQ